MEACAPGLAKEVADVIRHRSANPILPQLVSAQLDADRMDYLLRDAYFTGTKYGVFDLERLLRTLRVSDGRLVVKESGVYAVEYYIMARYHMYWQVYYHPVARSYENVIRMLFTRLRDLSAQGKEIQTVPTLLPLLSGEELTLDEFFPLDEYTCSYGFQLLTQDKDPIAADLAERILNRNLFKYEENTPENVEQIRQELKNSGYDERYYLAYDEVGQRPYVPYQGEDNKAIWILMHTGKIEELSKASAIVTGLVRGPVLSDDRIFYPLMKK
jgi:HD superfamily phosphohydrolase